MLIGLLLLQSAHAQRAFSVRYTTNSPGDIVYIGNTLMTCPAGSTGGGISCAAAQAGGNANDNDFSMTYVDVDGNAATFNSSSATLNLPAGATVLWAGLYWGGVSSAASRGQALLRRAGAFGYSPINANQLDVIGTSVYQGFADVTTQVQAGGSGTYWVANVQSSNSTTNVWAGWSIAVVYRDNTQTLRNMTVFDGLQVDPVTVTVSGFLTPLSGPVSSRIGQVLYDGDRASSSAGEVMTVNATSVTNFVNPANNYFNSTISDLGAHVTGKTPNYVNQLGYDIDRANVPSGVILNGATSASVGVVAPSETVYVGVISFATDVYIPIVIPNLVKTWADLNGGFVLAGDTLRYSISFTNTGQDTATNTFLTDEIPAGTTYKPNTLEVVSGANAGAKTDSSGDDQAEYVSSGIPRVTFRVGTDANASTGGDIPFDASTSVQFDVTVNSGLAAGQTITNLVNITYTGQTLGESVGTAAPQVGTTSIMVPPTITKSFSPNPIAPGGLSTLSIEVANPAANPGTVTGVTFSDTYPTDLFNAASPNPQITCTPGASAGTLTGGIAAGNTIGMSPGASIPPNGSCNITVNVTAAASNSYLNTTGAVGSSNAGTGGTSSATLSVGKPSITKAFAPASIFSGGTSTATFVIANPVNSAITGVAFSDTLSNMLVATPPNVVGNCGGGTVTATAGTALISLAGGSIAANGNCSISVNVTSSVTGIQPNTTTGVSSTQTGAAGNPSNTANLTVVGPPTATKTFNPISVSPAQSSLLTIVVRNPNPTTALSGVAFTDTYPTNLVNANPASPTLNCDAGSTATLTGGANGGGNIGISAGSLAANETCTVTVYVTSGTVATYNNSTGSIASNAGNGTAANASLVVSNLTAPTVAKAFAPTTMALGANSLLTITLTNSNGSIVTGAAFTDTYPINLVNAATPGATTTCTAGGATPTVTAAANGGNVSLSGGAIPANGSCTVTVNVTSNDVGSYFNNTGTITTANAGTRAGATATLTVLAPPSITKSFNADTVAVNQSSRLTLTILNPPTNGTTALTGINVIDTFPPSVTVTTTPNVNNTCAGTLLDQVGGNGTVGSGDTALRLSGVTLAAGASCVVQVNVQSNAAGNHLNTTTNVGATGPATLTGGSAAATLSVGQPDISKAFSPTTIVAGATSQLTITLTNPTGSVMNTATFTDSYPLGMTNTASPSATTNCTAGGASPIVTATANGTSVALANGGIPSNNSCTVQVNVTSTQTVINTIPAGDLDVNGDTASNGSPASATLTVTPPLSVTKSFSPSVIARNDTSRLSITLTNANAFNVTGVGFTDNYPANLFNTATPGATSTCTGGTVNAPVSGTSLAYSGGTVAANSTCTVSVNVTSATGDVYNNASGNVVTSNAGTASTVIGTLTVLAPPTATKAFTPSTISVNGTSTLTITLSNPNATQTITGVAFTDTYPANLVNAATLNASTSCGSATVIASPGGNSVALTGGSIPAAGSCNVSIDVTSSVSGTRNNSTGVITTGNAGNGTAANASLLVEPQPAVTKAIAPASVTAGAPATLTITISNPRTGALTGVGLNDTFPTGMRVHATPALTNTCSGGTVGGATPGSGAISLSGASIPAGGSCSISLAVTAFSVGSYANSTSGVSSNEAPLSNSSNTATLTVGGYGISGTVYRDTNHNAVLDSSPTLETGTGLTLFVKLASRSGATCTSPATAVATVTPATGAYSFAPFAAGDYCLILDNNNTLADVVPTLPAGWLNTEVVSGIKAITITGTNLIVQNFGLFNGSKLSGRVFADTGAGGGVANNGAQSGGELGIAGATVRANNAGCASTLCDSAVTDANGDYTLWIPAAASGSVTVTETNAAGYISVGGNAGSTGGSYVRTSDSTTFTVAVGSTYTGVNFADVPDNSFTTDGVQSALPGAIVSYAHSFTAGSGGSVSFATTNVATPTLAGWNNAIYRDTNCNGTLEAAEAGAPFAGTAMTAGQTVCIIVREFVPANAPTGAQDRITISAAFTYTGAAPALAANTARTDLTTVGTPSGAGLSLLKTVDKATALPGEVLTYTITYTNSSSEVLSSIVINDSTPAYTVYVGASAGCPNLVARTTCTVPIEPAANAVGAVRWSISGTLAPAASGTVRYQVRVE